MKYDLIIVGAGPCGIFTALELKKNNPDKNILILEKGNSISKRICPKRKTGNCINCSPCNITTGFAGAGAYSDGKLSLSPDVGGNLPEYIGYEKTQELIDYVDEIYLKFGADEKIYGIDKKKQINEIRKKAIKSNLKLVECPIRHMGTEEGYNIYSKIENYLKKIGVELKFRNPVKDIILDNNRKIKGVIADKEYLADKVIICIGREGSDWLKNLCHKHDIDTETGDVDIGVRVETRNEIMEELNEAMYESKLIYYTPTFDDKVRTFCTNPGGEVSTEYYDDNLAVVNGHSYKSDSLKTKNTNFALLVTKHFTKPFNSPIEYGTHIAKLGNMLSGNKILVQRYGDFKKGRRTNEKRLYRNNIIPTLKDAVPGDLSLVLPHRLLKDIDEMIIALDNIAPGLASDETLLYGVEVKFYSNKVITNSKFETNVKNLYVGGDGAGITRGLMQASVNGVLLGRQFS
ncbi:NAD(P)/FAD-dependent oxidoreductase [Anaerosalibacter massiliensis]|uniref:FAD-dependent oxidoreductase n=1 Tax=Anaerosalibacter massiliensis TaxID=1347392 RepID=A0A9X2MHW2_9FIRM|nr:FAD-dependent oxidoreductase [Anaerosalibacter massiliensis]MCR2043467.1 FAD-dependent oxidoreductase [Anaerosalibacter massiliensis]